MEAHLPTCICTACLTSTWKPNLQPSTSAPPHRGLRLPHKVRLPKSWHFHHASGQTHNMNIGRKNPRSQQNLNLWLTSEELGLCSKARSSKTSRPKGSWDLFFSAPAAQLPGVGSCDGLWAGLGLPSVRALSLTNVAVLCFEYELWYQIPQIHLIIIVAIIRQATVPGDLSRAHIYAIVVHSCRRI